MRRVYKGFSGFSFELVFGLVGFGAGLLDWGYRFESVGFGLAGLACRGEGFCVNNKACGLESIRAWSAGLQAFFVLVRWLLELPEAFEVT